MTHDRPDDVPCVSDMLLGLIASAISGGIVGIAIGAGIVWLASGG